MTRSVGARTTIADAREAGFDHHLVKPAEIDALQALLASPDDKRRDQPN